MTPASELVPVKPGDTGDNVLAWQKFLLENGFDIVTDGSYGDETIAATKKFQADAGIIADGIAGQATLDAATNKTHMLPEQGIKGIKIPLWLKLVVGGVAAYYLYKSVKGKK